MRGITGWALSYGLWKDLNGIFSFAAFGGLMALGHSSSTTMGLRSRSHTGPATTMRKKNSHGKDPIRMSAPKFWNGNVPGI